MDDIWQPPDVIEKLTRDLRSDSATWALLLDRFREAEELHAIGQKIGKRPDLEPEYFPKRKRPIANEIAGAFLKRKFGKEYDLVNSQLAMEARKLAESEI